MRSLREWFDGREDRERKLIIALLVIFAVIVPVSAWHYVSTELAEQRARNDALRSAIRIVQASKERFEDAKDNRGRIERKYESQAPALAGFIENAARKSDLEIPESQDQANVPSGKKYVERSTVVRLRKVGMLPLVTMLEAIENSGHPIVVSRLNIKKRGREADFYDVELGVTAYDRVQDDKPPKATPSPSSSEAKP